MPENLKNSSRSNLWYNGEPIELLGIITDLLSARVMALEWRISSESLKISSSRGKTGIANLDFSQSQISHIGNPYPYF